MILVSVDPTHPSPTVTAFVSIGSNINAEANVTQAIREVAKHAKMVGLSTLYKTQFLKSDGTVSQNSEDTFINGVFAIQTSLPPLVFREKVLREVERSMGRSRNHKKFDARKIDLDLVMYGNLNSTTPDLKLPRPDLRTRDFVAIPLLEIAPNLILPDTHERLSDVAKKTICTNMRPERELTQRIRKEILK